MTFSVTLPVLAGSLLLAVAGGIELGESTIGLINPIHFQGPAIHPRDRGAAIEEPGIRPSEPSFASLYGWDEGHSAKFEDCGDCEALAARDAYAEPEETSISVYRALVHEWEEPVLADEEGHGIGGPEEVDDYDVELKERIARYAYYEIEADGDAEAEAVYLAEGE